MTECTGDELPPAGRAVIEVQELRPALIQHMVEDEDRQVDHYQQEERITRLIRRPQLRLLCAVCRTKP